MSLSVIPLTILGQITGVSGSGDTVLYRVSFKSIDGTPLYGVTVVWTDEQAEIEALAAQKPYGVWINPIDGTFTVKFAGYTYVGSADLTDADVLAGVTPIEFANQNGGGSLPAVTGADNGKVLAVVNGAWDKSDVPYTQTTTLFSGNATVVDFDGMYGFNLGQIEGLDSSVKTVTLTLEKDGQSNTYVLTYFNNLDLWADSSSPKTTTVQLTRSYSSVDAFDLMIFAYDELDVGQTYNIQIKADTADASFRSATEQVINQTTLKTGVFYINYRNVRNAAVGYNDLPLYRDRSLTEQAHSGDVYGHDAYIICSVDSDGVVTGTYNPYYTFAKGSYFIAKWSQTSASDPLQPHIILGQIID